MLCTLRETTWQQHWGLVFERSMVSMFSVFLSQLLRANMLVLLMIFLEVSLVLVQLHIIMPIKAGVLQVYRSTLPIWYEWYSKLTKVLWEVTCSFFLKDSEICGAGIVGRCGTRTCHVNKQRFWPCEDQNEGNYCWDSCFREQWRG